MGGSTLQGRGNDLIRLDCELTTKVGQPGPRTDGKLSVQSTEVGFIRKGGRTTIKEVLCTINKAIMPRKWGLNLCVLISVSSSRAVCEQDHCLFLIKSYFSSRLS